MELLFKINKSYLIAIANLDKIMKMKGQFYD